MRMHFHTPVRRFEKIDVVHSMLIGFVVDVVSMFGLWPAFGQPFPTLGQFIITIVFGQAVGLTIIYYTRVHGRNNRHYH